MTEARKLLDALRRIGVTARVREDGALVLNPGDLLTDELLAAAKRLKPALVEVLSGNGADRSQLPWVRDLAETLAATAPPGGWPPTWRDELRIHRPAAYRRVERAEFQCEALIARLCAGEDAGAAWKQALREYEVTLFDMRAVLVKRAMDAARREAWA